MTNVLHLSTFDIDGGAARAAFRLNNALNSSGVNSAMLVHKKDSDEATVFSNSDINPFSKLLRMGRPYIDEIPLHFCRKKINTPFSISWLPSYPHKRITQINPQIIHTHWINAGFLSVMDLSKLAKNNKRIVWTLHDAWPMTGGCHLYYQCDRFVRGCGHCPQLGSNANYDLSSLGIKRKADLFKKINPIFIAPSKWMANQAKSSYLLSGFRVEMIPHGLDANSFKPINKQEARKYLGIPTDKKLILFGASNSVADPRKGFSRLIESLAALKNSKISNEIEVLIFGGRSSIDSKSIGFPVHSFGHLSDDISLSLVYSAADIFCAPSSEESFGQVVIESLSCGTPVVAFESTGFIDTIIHMNTGFLAKPLDTLNFASGIECLLQDGVRLKQMSINARASVLDKFDSVLMARRHKELYDEILAGD